MEKERGKIGRARERGRRESEDGNEGQRDRGKIGRARRREGRRE